jgi:hypothetical protein
MRPKGLDKFKKIASSGIEPATLYVKQLGQMFIFGDAGLFLRCCSPVRSTEGSCMVQDTHREAP